MRLRDIFWIIDTKNSRALITKWAEKAGKDADKIISYVEETYKETNDQLAAGKWICEGYEPKQFPQALYICKQKKLDPLKENPSQLIQDNPDVKPKEKAINPDTVLSDRQEDGEGNVTYAARDEDREVLRQLINTHYGIDANPWCLLQADKDGKLTKDSTNYWNKYSAYPKRIAFRDGKLLAFSAGTKKKMREWWDRFDRSFPFIPYDGKRWLGKNGGTFEIRKGNVFETKGSTTSRLNTSYSLNIENTYRAVTINTQRHTITIGGESFPYSEKDGKYVVDTSDAKFTVNRELELEGPFEKYYPDGQLRIKCTYKHDKKEGPYEDYYTGGQLRTRGVFKHDEFDGPCETYYENGQLFMKSTCKDGRYNGPYEYYYENGRLKIKNIYKNGKREGLGESYYENGQLKTRCVYKNDKVEGPYESYYENGQLKSKQMHKNGKPNGPSELYYDSGQLREKCTYKDGKLDGLYESYFDNGKLKDRCTYKDDEIVK